MLNHSVADPRHALAAATPFLRMFSLVTAGWLMARSALAAKGHLDAGTGDAEQMQAKIQWAILNTRSSVEPFLSYSDRRDLRERVWRTRAPE